MNWLITKLTSGRTRFHLAQSGPVFFMVLVLVLALAMVLFLFHPSPAYPILSRPIAIPFNSFRSATNTGTLEPSPEPEQNPLPLNAHTFSCILSLMNDAIRRIGLAFASSTVPTSSGSCTQNTMLLKPTYISLYNRTTRMKARVPVSRKAEAGAGALDSRIKFGELKCPVSS